MGSGVSRFMANQKLAECRKLYESTLEMWNKEKINFTDQMVKIHESLHFFDKLPIKERQEYRMKAGDSLAENKCVRIICEQITDALSQTKEDHRMLQVYVKEVVSEGQNKVPKKNILELALQSIAMVTEPDCSAEACKEVLLQGELLNVLTENTDKAASKPLPKEGVRIVHNMAVFLSECRDGYTQTHRSAATITQELITKMTTFLKGHEGNSKILTVTALACIETDSMEDSNAQFLCLNLSMAFDEADHRNKECTLTAMARGIRHLLTIRLKSDKDPVEALQKCGVVRLLAKGASSTIYQESMACLESLRILCREQKCREEMGKDDGFIKLLAKHYRPVPKTPKDEITKLMLERLYRSNVVKDEDKVNRLVSAPDQVLNITGHVMLSYQWRHKEKVREINRILKKAGINTWIDEEKMMEKDDINDGMAAAVEQCSVFLMCISRSYAESKNCKKEATYAETLNKRILPVMLETEHEYVPYGWVGIMRGSKLYFEFSPNLTDEQFNKKANELVQKIKSLPEYVGNREQDTKTNPDDGKKAQQENIQKLPVSCSRRKTTSVAPYCRIHPNALCVARSDGFLHCCCERIDPRRELLDWATRYKLKGEAVRSLSKSDLGTLIQLRDQAPDFFYKRVWNDLKMKSVTELTRFNRALSSWEKEKGKQQDHSGCNRSHEQLGPNDKSTNTPA